MAHFGIEALSRGSKFCVFCDKSYKSINMLKQNIEKTKLQNKCLIVNEDYKKCIDNQKKKFDIIFIDPPYKYDIGVDSIERILKQNLLSKDGIIVLETDEEDRDIKEIEKIDLEVYDVRKYGRVKLIFLRERG